MAKVPPLIDQVGHKKDYSPCLCVSVVKVPLLIDQVGQKKEYSLCLCVSVARIPPRKNHLPPLSQRVGGGVGVGSSPISNFIIVFPG